MSCENCKCGAADAKLEALKERVLQASVDLFSAQMSLMSENDIISREATISAKASFFRATQLYVEYLFEKGQAEDE